MKTLAAAAFVLILAVPPATTAAQSSTDSPEPVILTLVKAIYANDIAAYDRVTVPDPRRTKLTAGGRSNPAKLRQLDEDPESLQMHKRRPFLFRGTEAVIEVPFVVRKIGSDWRVEPQPYFALFMR